MIKTIDPQEWSEYLAGFSTRNRGRRARFELFSGGGVAEESEEGVFDRIAIENDIATVTRIDRSEGNDSTVTAEIKGVRGIAVQLDTDNSENTLEFTNSNGDMTVLHFESRVDGDS